ncbi:hypothetical protein DMH25_00015 [Streptomyces sp. WAC 01325]|uniref:DUF397 domain-containing protein n=1 Tax=Streptomyces sp. WAC 01325 TaxID=2203202 RepID=UPI000F8716CC|nr:DUF397 domain-containing protein [Streptomyces sp. WAC 01325]RSN18869.1 hypothetical protein DMH25_00015 [Streptomyces sp. WAC 01325]
MEDGVGAELRDDGFGTFREVRPSAIAEQGVCVRDSKDVTRPDFAVGREEWPRFVGFVADA